MRLGGLGAKERGKEARRARGEGVEGVGCAWGGCGDVLGRYKGVVYPSKTAARRRRAKIFGQIPAAKRPKIFTT